MNYFKRLIKTFLWFIFLINLLSLVFCLIENNSLTKNSTYSLLKKSVYSLPLSSLSSNRLISNSGASISSSESQATEDALATSDLSLGAQASSDATLVSDEQTDSSIDSRSEKFNKKNLLLKLPTTTEYNGFKISSALNNKIVNDALLEEDAYLKQHLNSPVHHHHSYKDYSDLKSSLRKQKRDNNEKDKNINYSNLKSSPLDTGHAVFKPLQQPSNLEIESQTTFPIWKNSKSKEKRKDNITFLNKYPAPEKSEIGVCKDGLIMPAWRPLLGLTGFDRTIRGLIYFFVLCYLFVGVSIIADRFMAAIEVITSQEKDVVIRQPNGETHVISVRIWNETVSNLTLMALGSSAPEILLSIIEVYAQDFNPGDLGPGTIVGSAAFNMFIIIAVCVWVVPTNEIKKIKHLRVYCVTMVWSVFAYVWLIIILQYFSYGVVEIWEGLLTFVFFFATVLTAYIADRRLLFYKYLNKKYRVNNHGIIIESEGQNTKDSSKKHSDDLELTQVVTNVLNHKQRKSSKFLSFRNSSVNGSLPGSNVDGGLKVFDREEDSEEVKEFEQHRRDYIQILKRLRKKHPDAAMESLEMMAREEIVKQGPRSRAFYRLQATKKLTGGTPFKRHRDKNQENKDNLSLSATQNQKPVREDHVIKLFFNPAHYTVFENVGQFAVRIVREGPLNCSVSVHVKTEDGTANGGSDYIEIDEDVHFAPGEETKEVFIQVIDDDIFEEDEHFYVHLTDPRLLDNFGDANLSNTAVQENITNIDVQQKEHLSQQNSVEQQIPHLHCEKPLEVRLGTAANATVMILDDDHSGVFSFPEAEVEINETIGLYLLKVVRNSGARGRIYLPFKVVEANAHREIDFELIDGELVFDNNETWQEIPIQIIDLETYEKDLTFFVELGEPRREEDESTENSDSPLSLSVKEKVALQGKPRLGEIHKVKIRIKESKEFKETVDKLFQKTTASSLIESSSWKEQFIQAFTIQLDDDETELDDQENKPQRSPSFCDYLTHLLTVFWKVLFAFVPPTEYLNGWVCFWTCILIIGILTAIIGDFSSHLGCSIGLKDTITAIAFVALGTSIPDTFASKVAAINDKHADSSIGNVTGSNAVNVFLGIGVAWTLAALVKSYRGQKFEVDPGSIGFSVILFCVCAAVCCIILVIRRYTLGGELGGPMKWKLLTTLSFIGLWLIYLFLSSLEIYGYLSFVHSN